MTVAERWNLETWTAALCQEFAVDPPPSPDILNLTRAVAHEVARPAAPLTCFLIGLALRQDLSWTDARAAVERLIERGPLSDDSYARGIDGGEPVDVVARCQDVGAADGEPQVQPGARHGHGLLPPKFFGIEPDEALGDHAPAAARDRRQRRCPRA